jgi:glycosyltransferase involved in cell wall biosynthesis
MSYPSISIGIITRNRADLLEKCLSNLLKQNIKPEAVIIVNNNSTDNTEKIINKYIGVLNIKSYNENKIGIPFARNKVLEKCTSEILAFTDDDCLPPKQWLRNILKSHLKNPQATVIQGRTLPLNERSLKSILFRTNYEYWIWKNLYDKNLLSVCDTNNISLKLKNIQQLKIRFSTSLSRGSDVDFAKKVIKKGGQILYDKKIKNFHAMRGSWMAFYYQRFKMGRAQILLNKKWPDSNRDKGFNKDYYQQTITSMFNSVSGFRRIILLLLYKTYHQVFWIGISQPVAEKEKQITPQKYLLNKKIVNISVAIVTRNREAYLEECLRSIIKQTVMPSEVVIIDNASNDGTKYLSKKYSNILPIKYYFESKIGTAYARNKALAVSLSPVTAFLDDDCIASSDWLKEIDRAHRKNPHVLAIQGSCRVIPFKGALSYVYQTSYYHWLSNLTYGQNKLLTLDTANASFKNDLVKKLSIKFDTKFTKYCDDEDFCQQIIIKNKEVLYWPKALVGSRRRMSRSEFFKERFRKGLAKAIFDQKWNRILKRNTVSLQGLNIKLRGFYNPPKSRVRQVILNPNSNNLLTFFNKKDKSILLMYKIRLITILFELLYHVGYFIKRMKLRFQLLDEAKINQIKEKPNLSLSVMIITKDRGEDFKKTLDSLVYQTVKPNQVIIVDSSKKISTDFLVNYQGKINIKYINEPNPGFGVARNKALYNCTTDLISTIDDDAIADPNWCKNIILAHAESSAVAIQGRIICHPKDSLIAQVEQIRLDKWFLGNLGLKNKFWTISTKNVSFKVKLLLEQGIQFLEDPLIGKYGSEDLDIANRIIQSQQTIEYFSNIKVIHFERKNIFSYIRQQYRKGCSNAVYDFVWQGVLNKPSYYLKMKKVLEPFLLIEAHPYTDKNYFKKIMLVLVYFVSLFFFNVGKKVMKNNLQKNSYKLNYLKIHKSSSNKANVAVLLTNLNDAYLQKILFSLKNQTQLFSELYICKKLNKTEDENLSKNYQKYFKLNFFDNYDLSANQVLNEVINSKRFEYLKFLNFEAEISSSWLEQSINTFKKNPQILALSDLLIYRPKNSISNILSQFNYQSFIRSTMLPDKKKYWQLVSGEKMKKFQVNFFELNSGALNINNLRKLKITFKKQIEFNSAVVLGQHPFTRKIVSFLDPNNQVILNNHWGFMEIFEVGFKEGEMSFESNYVSNKITFINFTAYLLKRILAFSNFCIKNYYFYQIAPAILIYSLYQTGVFAWVFSKKRNIFKGLFVITTR